MRSAPWPSAHAALAFGCWVAVTFVAAGTTFALPISAITLFLAVLVAQSRVQSKIHTLTEVAVGAALGIAITALLFRIWYPICAAHLRTTARGPACVGR